MDQAPVQVQAGLAGLMQVLPHMLYFVCLLVYVCMHCTEACVLC